jgi:hypothetical protein
MNQSSKTFETGKVLTAQLFLDYLHSVNYLLGPRLMQLTFYLIMKPTFALTIQEDFIMQKRKKLVDFAM